MKQVVLLRLSAEEHAQCYEQLLQFASSRSTVFQLVERHTVEMSTEARQALRRLSPYQLSAFETAEWPGTSLCGGQTALVRKYQCNSASIEILLSLASSLLEWQQPELPEDLCFLDSTGLQVLGVTAHEGFVFSELKPSELTQLRKKCPSLILE